MTEAEQFRAAATAALTTKFGIALEARASEANVPDRYHEWIPIEETPRIIANAHLTPQGFNDLTEALNQARDAYTAECERWLQAETQHHQEETL